MAKFEEEPCPLYEELDVNLGRYTLFIFIYKFQDSPFSVHMTLFLFATNRQQPIEASQHNKLLAPSPAFSEDVEKTKGESCDYHIPKTTSEYLYTTLCTYFPIL